MTAEDQRLFPAKVSIRLRPFSDNGAGMAMQTPGRKSGLGTSLIKALAQQLDAKVEIATRATGTTVNVTRATFQSPLPTVA
jgi:chemotaxis protein methyltransferase CheR